MPAGSSRIVVRLDHDGARAVAEEHRDVAPLGREVDAGRVHLAADDQHAPVLRRCARTRSRPRASRRSRCTARAGRSRASRRARDAPAGRTRCPGSRPAARASPARCSRCRRPRGRRPRARAAPPRSARSAGLLARRRCGGARMPERCRIHSSLVSISFARSLFVTTRVGHVHARARDLARRVIATPPRAAARARPRRSRVALAPAASSSARSSSAVQAARASSAETATPPCRAAIARPRRAAAGRSC